mgnify:FL=1
MIDFFGLKNEKSNGFKYSNVTKSSETEVVVKVPKININDLILRLKSHLTFFHTVSNPVVNSMIKRDSWFKEIEITSEKHLNKYLTRVRGLESLNLKLQDIVSELQVKYATSGYLHQYATKQKDKHEICVQGLFDEEIKNYMVETYGLDETIFTMVNKVKKNK